MRTKARLAISDGILIMKREETNRLGVGCSAWLGLIGKRNNPSVCVQQELIEIVSAFDHEALYFDRLTVHEFQAACYDRSVYEHNLFDVPQWVRRSADERSEADLSVCGSNMYRFGCCSPEEERKHDNANPPPAGNK